MDEHCEGYFTSTEVSQPVIDLYAFVRFDPTEERPTMENGDPFHALGLYESFYHIYTSDNIPGIGLFPSGGDIEETRLMNSWAAVGQFEKMENSTRKGYDERPYDIDMIGRINSSSIRDFLLHTAIQQYIGEQKKYYFKSHDLALVKHSRFGARKLKKLRLEILSAGFDLPAIARDVKVMWGNEWKNWYGIEVASKQAPWARHRNHVDHDLLEEFRKIAEDSFARLERENSIHREVLTTAS